MGIKAHQGEQMIFHIICAKYGIMEIVPLWPYVSMD
jgi:hypothetical protein